MKYRQTWWNPPPPHALPDRLIDLGEQPLAASLLIRAHQMGRPLR